MNPTHADVNKIRDVVIAYFRSTPHPFARAFIEELERDTVNLNGTPGIGFWEFEEVDGRPALVRNPPISAEVRYWGVYLDNEEGAWKAIGDFQGSERFELEE